MKIIKNTLTIFILSIFIVPNISGSSLPENISELIEPIQTPEIIEKIEIGEHLINLYYYEDFIMLSNQGIFRDSAFLIDKERKIIKKFVGPINQEIVEKIEMITK